MVSQEAKGERNSPRRLYNIDGGSLTTASAFCVGWCALLASANHADCCGKTTGTVDGRIGRIRLNMKLLDLLILLCCVDGDPPSEAQYLLSSRK